MIRKFPSISDPTATYFMKIQDISVAGLCELVDNHYYAIKNVIDPAIRPDYAYIGCIDDSIDQYVKYYLIDLNHKIVWTAIKAIRFLPTEKVFRHTIIKENPIADQDKIEYILQRFGELL